MSDTATGINIARFPTSSDSPFPDGYDIEAEREALKDMLEADTVDQSDPRYLRYVELESREDQLSKMRRVHDLRQGANTDLKDKEAMAIREMGKLTMSEDDNDSVEIHTMHAARLFMGREVKPGDSGYSMTGGRRVASALKSIWHDSSSDNPYADYILILVDDRMDQIRREIDKRITVMQKQFSNLEQQGMRFHVLRNPKPYVVPLGFKSPYGYAVMMIINRYDYYVRMVRSLVSKSLLTDKAGHDQILEITRQCRSIFEEAVRLQRILSKQQLKGLSRSDFLPTADDLAKKRVIAIVALLGELPREVFAGQIKPKHSRRKSNVSEQEQKLLNEVPLNVDIPEDALATMI